MMRRALQNTGWLMGARGINAVLSLVYLALATRALGLEGFGQFVLAFTFAQLVVGFTSFQTWQAIVRWGQTEDERSTATGFALALDALTIVTGTAAAALILWLAGDWLPIAPDLRLPTFLFTLVSLLAIRSTPTGLLRVHDKYARAAAADSTTSMMRAAGAGLVALFAPSITAFLVVWGIAEIATAAMYWWMAGQTERIEWRRFSLSRLPREQRGEQRGERGGKQGGEAGGKAWSFVIGTSLSGMLTIASRQLLVLLVGGFGGAALAGIYRVAAQLGEGLLKLAQALLRAVYPELVRNPESARKLAGKMTKLAMVTGVVVVGFGLVAGEWIIIAIAGSAFLAAYWPMIILAAAAALELAGASLEALLLAHGRAITNFLLRGIPTAIGLLALPWLVDALGAAGAALVVLGTSVMTVAGLVFVRRNPRD